MRLNAAEQIEPCSCVSITRHDANVTLPFYAFCRVIDNVGFSTVECRRKTRASGEMAKLPVLHTAGRDEPLLARDVRQLIAKYSLSLHMLEHCGCRNGPKYAAISYL